MIAIKIHKQEKRSNKSLLEYLLKLKEESKEEQNNISVNNITVERIEVNSFENIVITYKGKETSNINIHMNDLPANMQKDLIRLIFRKLPQETKTLFHQFACHNIQALCDEINKNYNENFIKITLMGNRCHTSNKISVNIWFNIEQYEFSEEISIRIPPTTKLVYYWGNNINSIDQLPYLETFDYIKKTIINEINAHISHTINKRNEKICEQRKQEKVNSIEKRIYNELKSKYKGWVFTNDFVYLKNSKKAKIKYNILQRFDKAKLSCHTVILSELDKFPPIKDFDYYYQDEDEFVQECIDKADKYLLDKKFDCSESSFVHKILDCKAIKSFYKDLKTIAHPLFNGLQETTSNFTAYAKFPDASTIYIANSLLSGTIINGVLSFKIDDKYYDILKDSKLKKYPNCIAYCEELFNKLNINLTYISGYGLLYGTTKVYITDKTYQSYESIIQKQEPVTLTLPNYKDSISIWKKELKKQLSSFIKSNKIETNQTIEVFKKENSECIESFLVSEIYNVIKENEQYITANMVSQLLRTCSAKANVDLIYTDNCGKFNLYSNDEVLSIIKHLIHSDAIKEKQLKGTFGRFNILKLDSFQKFMIKYPTSIDEIIKNLDSNNPITDVNCASLLEFIKSKDILDVSDYLLLLRLIHNTGFLCLYHNDFINIFSSAPSEIKDLVKMKISVEQNKTEKKILKEIKSIIV